jgi:rod shape-determining protein MreD
MKPTTFERHESVVAKIVPIGTALCLAFLSVLPLRIPGYAAVTPAFALMAVYHWTIYRPELLPAVAVFGIGLAVDLLSGAPLGVASLTLVLARTLVMRQRHFFVNKLFPFVWMGFTLLAGVVMAFLWALGSLLNNFLLDPRAAAFQCVLTVACFPAVSYVLMRLQRTLLVGG